MMTIKVRACMAFLSLLIEDESLVEDEDASPFQRYKARYFISVEVSS